MTTVLDDSDGFDLFRNEAYPDMAGASSLWAREPARMIGSRAQNTAFVTALKEIRRAREIDEAVREGFGAVYGPRFSMHQIRMSAATGAVLPEEVTAISAVWRAHHA